MPSVAPVQDVEQPAATSELVSLAASVDRVVSGGPGEPAVVPRERKLSRRALKQQGRDEFETTAIAAAHGDQEALAELPGTVERSRGLYRGNKFDEKAWEVMAVAARDVLADDLVTTEEEQHIGVLAAAIGVDLTDIIDRNFELFEELAIARINSGRLPVTASGPIITKPGEIAYAATPVALMKEVAIRETRGGTQGVSVRVMKGVTYRVGQIRARSVVVGTEWQVQDTGQLVVTNQRAVFVGQKRTLEFLFTKLVGMEQFADGLRLSVSNRQLASMFRFPPRSSPSITAALIAHCQ